jgi:hypothetical protein
MSFSRSARRYDSTARFGFVELVIKQIRDAVPSPDGRKLAFVSLDRLYVMDPNGTPRRLTSANAGEFEPSWSPGGQWIMY